MEYRSTTRARARRKDRTVYVSIKLLRRRRNYRCRAIVSNIIRTCAWLFLYAEPLLANGTQRRWPIHPSERVLRRS